MRISDWSSDVCSSDLISHKFCHPSQARRVRDRQDHTISQVNLPLRPIARAARRHEPHTRSPAADVPRRFPELKRLRLLPFPGMPVLHSNADRRSAARRPRGRSEEHTSELQSLMRISYDVFCLTKKIIISKTIPNDTSVDDYLPTPTPYQRQTSHTPQNLQLTS